MKRILLGMFFGLAGTYAMAQCTPDMSVAGDVGIHPDSATNFAVAYVGTPYGQTVTAVIPADTCAQLLPAPLPCTTLAFDSVVVTSVTGLPAGFTFTCAPPNCRFLGNSMDCAIITGTATAGQVGTYNLVFALDAYVGGIGIPNSYTLDYYKIIVLPAVGVEEEATAITFAQNSPNPFDAATNIEFALSKNDMVQFEVFNLIGQNVHSRTVSGVAGSNVIRFDGSDFPAGTYLYKIKVGNTVVTKRMIITH